jgi:Putative transposase
LAESAAFAERLDALCAVEWVVYAKRPFAGPEQVLAYLGRYTHRVALANSRLTRLSDSEVDFTWKDYRHHGKTKVMTLAADEFIRRFNEVALRALG